MKLLLDTCTFLWLVSDPARLSSSANRELQSPGNTLFLSTVSAWEIGVLYSRGRLVVHRPLPALISVSRRRYRLRTLALREAAALYVANLPHLHKDPFDRMLICQAIVHNLTILTPDPLIQAYPVRTLW